MIKRILYSYTFALEAVEKTRSKYEYGTYSGSWLAECGYKGYCLCIAVSNNKDSIPRNLMQYYADLAMLTLLEKGEI